MDLTTRSADCFVFALHAEKDEEIANILDLGQWKFYVLSTKVVEAHFGSQKSVSLGQMKRYAPRLAITD